MEPNDDPKKKSLASLLGIPVPNVVQNVAAGVDPSFGLIANALVGKPERDNAAVQLAAGMVPIPFLTIPKRVTGAIRGALAGVKEGWRAMDAAKAAEAAARSVPELPFDVARHAAVEHSQFVPYKPNALSDVEVDQILASEPGLEGLVRAPDEDVLREFAELEAREVERNRLRQPLKFVVEELNTNSIDPRIRSGRGNLLLGDTPVGQIRMTDYTREGVEHWDLPMALHLGDWYGKGAAESGKHFTELIDAGRLGDIAGAVAREIPGSTTKKAQVYPSFISDVQERVKKTSIVDILRGTP